MPTYRGSVLFHEAVIEMARSPKPLQGRIVDAMHHVASCDLPGSLPPHIMVDFKALVARTTSVDPTELDIAGEFDGEGSFAATCMTMPDEEAAAVADRIVRIHEALEELDD